MDAIGNFLVCFLVCFLFIRIICCLLDVVCMYVFMWHFRPYVRRCSTSEQDTNSHPIHRPPQPLQHSTLLPPFPHPIHTYIHNLSIPDPSHPLPRSSSPHLISQLPTHTITSTPPSPITLPPSTPIAATMHLPTWLPCTRSPLRHGVHTGSPRLSGAARGDPMRGPHYMYMYSGAKNYVCTYVCMCVRIFFLVGTSREIGACVYVCMYMGRCICMGRGKVGRCEGGRRCLGWAWEGCQRRGGAYQMDVDVWMYVQYV